MKKFLEKNYKWIYKLLVTIGILLLLNLWIFGLSIQSGNSGGFLALPTLWGFKYYWTNAGYVSISLLIISILLIFKAKKIEKVSTKLSIALIILVLGLISKSLFLLISPDYNFFLTPVTSQYKDKEGNVTDVDKYLEMITKYCDYYSAGDLNYRTTRLDMCIENDKYQTFFNTAEEYIKVFEYAKNHNDRFLYQRTYGGVNKFGVEKLLEKYDDATFQAYVLWNEWSNDNIRGFILKKNSSFTKLINFINESLINGEKLNYGEFKNKRDYWDSINLKIKEQLNLIPEINQKIF